MDVLDNDAMREADRITIEEGGVPSLTLMEKAGEAVTAQACDLLGREGRRVVVVCGKGNNGGDGLVVARLLKERGLEVTAYVLAPLLELSKDSQGNHARALAAGVALVETSGDKLAAHPIANGDLIVDALFGTGVTRALAAPWREAAKTINDAGCPVLAVDLPSGLSGSSGEILGDAVRATRTVALQAPKWCHVLAPAHELCGDVRVADIGIAKEALARVSSAAALITARDAMAAFPPRALDSHKVTYGRLLVIAGSRAMPGAAILATEGALMGGAGLITLASVPFVHSAAAARLPDVLQMALPETASGAPDRASVTELLARPCTAAVIGPGLGSDPSTRDLCLDLVKGLPCPLVIDADGLNALASARAFCGLIARKAATILTPHPGELRRLLPDAKGDRRAQARRLADETGCLVVLKGHRTLVAEPGGRLAVCLQGSPALARGGTGDVLSGLIGSCLARGIDPFAAATAAVYLHGLAGELLARERGEHMVPANAIPAALPYALRIASKRAQRANDVCADAPITEL